MPMCSEMREIMIYSNNTRTNRNELMRRLLSGITTSELQNLVRMQEEARRPIPAVQMRGEEARYPIRAPTRRTQDRPIPFPRTKKQQPVPAPRTKINEKRRALNGFTKSYEIELRSNRDAIVELQNTRLAISRLFSTMLNNMKFFKFVETIVVIFNKRKDDKTIYSDPIYFNSRTQILINPNDFFPSLELSQQQLLNGIGVWLSKGSSWAIDVYEHVYVYEMLCMNQQRDHLIYHYQWSYRIQAGVW